MAEEGGEFSLIKLDGFAKPATVLIEKISDAVGGIFKPFQMRRVAKAEAEAERVRAESHIEVTDLHRRAMRRFLEEEAKRQENIESITKQALPLLAENSTPEKIADDWITNFFEKSRIVSDQDMQQIWSRILAEEANQPGTFGKRTVNLLGDLDKRDAELFTTVCGFLWTLQKSQLPLILKRRDVFYTEHGIEFGMLNHLDSLGLIKFAETGVRFFHLRKTMHANYFGQNVELTFPQDDENELGVGEVLFTTAGFELSRICGAKPVDGFFDYVHQIWEQQSLVPKRNADAQSSAAR